MMLSSGWAVIGSVCWEQVDYGAMTLDMTTAQSFPLWIFSFLSASWLLWGKELYSSMPFGHGVLSYLKPKAMEPANHGLKLLRWEPKYSFLLLNRYFPVVGHYDNQLTTTGTVSTHLSSNSGSRLKSRIPRIASTGLHQGAHYWGFCVRLSIGRNQRLRNVGKSPQMQSLHLPSIRWRTVP